MVERLLLVIAIRCIVIKKALYNFPTQIEIVI